MIAVPWAPERSVTANGGVYRSDALRTLKAEPRSRAAVNIGLVIPMHGSAGLFGLSCLSCAVLAAEEINDEGGVLGREVRLVPVDGAGRPAVVARRVATLIGKGAIDAVAGWHLSNVRRALAAQVHGVVPYVYSALYEGGERTPGVFLAGETPDRQLAPAIAWMAQELGVRRWAVIGDDYVWPRGTAAAVHAYVHDQGLQIVEELFVPLGQENFDAAMARLWHSRADAVLCLLVGQDAVHFNRAFAAAGLDERMIRLSPLMDENMLLASGPEATRHLYSAAGYFDSLATADALDLVGRYARRFGPDAPVVTSMGESCYESLRLLATLAQQAGSLDVQRLLARAETAIGYEGPRGSVHLEERHLIQDVYLARADGTVFDVLTLL